MKEKPQVRWRPACFVTVGNFPHVAYQQLFLNNTQKVWHCRLQSSLLLFSARPRRSTLRCHAVSIIQFQPSPASFSAAQQNNKMLFSVS
jgi:hypothetical protein